LLACPLKRAGGALVPASLLCFCTKLPCMHTRFNEVLLLHCLCPSLHNTSGYLNLAMSHAVTLPCNPPFVLPCNQPPPNFRMRMQASAKGTCHSPSLLRSAELQLQPAALTSTSTTIMNRASHQHCCRGHPLYKPCTSGLRYQPTSPLAMHSLTECCIGRDQDGAIGRRGQILHVHVRPRWTGASWFSTQQR